MELSLKIKTSSLEKKTAEPFIEIIKNDLNGKSESNIVIKIANDGRGLRAYYEEISKENLLGRVSCENNDSLETIIQYDYACRINSVNGLEMSANIKTLTDIEQSSQMVVADSSEYADMVAEGYFTQEMLNRRVSWAEGHGVDSAIVRACFDRIKSRGLKGTEITPCSTMYVDPEKGEKAPVKFVKNMLVNILTGAAFVMEGPKSVGKSCLAKCLAWFNNMELFVIQLNENTSDGDVYGEKSTDNSAANSITVEMALAKVAVDTARYSGKIVDAETEKLAADFEYYKALASSVKIEQALGVWVQWLQRGGVMCLNEMDMADANFFSMLVNQILDGTGFMTVPGYGRVDVNPNCVLIGTQNGAEYAGTNGQNAASISRFDVYRLPQPKDVLSQLTSACKGEGFDIEDKYLIACNEFYKELIKKTGMSGFEGVLSDTCLNIRGMVRALKAVKLSGYTLTLKDRLKLSVVNACSDDERCLVMQSLNEKVVL